MVRPCHCPFKCFIDSSLWSLNTPECPDPPYCCLLITISAIFAHQMETEELRQNMYPLMYVHNMYSNMVDKLWQHMRVSWSFYMQADNGRLVVIRSQPQYYTEYTVLQDLDDNTGEGKPQRQL